MTSLTDQLAADAPPVLERGSFQRDSASMTSDFKPRSDLVRVLRERGHIYQATDLEGLDRLALEGPISAYIGFDATASSLHVGSLVQIMTLRRLQQTGHRPIVLMGGGTTKVGDPSDKNSQRPLLTDDVINANIAGIKRAFAPFLRFGDGPTDAIMANNADWLEKLGYIEFLRDYGVHFTINKMLSFEFVKNRLQNEQPLTFLEFNYMLMQAADFLELNRRHGCRLQFGGSEQWGNIVNGIDLIRRTESREAFGLTAPLVTTSSGAKMGKTVDGAVWLNAELRSPYDYWQFWRNTEDGDVGRFLRLFTELPIDEIARLENLGGAEINEAKKVLANEATTLLHGREAAETAAAAARTAFEQGGVSRDMPIVELAKGDFELARSTEALVKAAGLATSLTAARKLIAQGGVRINDVRIMESRYHNYAELLPELDAFKVQVGKTRIVLVRPV
jgi:tyrosyl-tRNA synthetase